MSGANLALMEYFEILLDMNFDLRVISPSEGSCTVYLKNKNIPVTIIPFYSWARQKKEGFFIKGWFKRVLRNTYACCKIIQIAKNADAVCTNTICTHLGVVSAKFCHKKHLLFVHEFGEEDHGFKLMISTSRAYNWLYKNSEKIVLNSNAIKQKWVNIVKQTSKLEVLYNCFNSKNNTIPHEPQLKPESHKFLMLGQISEAKGHHLAIEALESLSEKYGNIEMDIIGSKVDEGYYQGLQMRIASSKAKINLKEPVANPFLIFKNYTSMLMCSRMEAFGRVTVEALSCGLPVIGINSGGTPEIIENDVNGFLVNSKQPKELKDTIEKMICMDEDTYSQISLNALQIKNKFNSEISRKQLETIFETLNTGICQK